MATFEECGIRYLTAASIQAFRENSALWVLRYLMGRSDFRSPAFARSLALGDGMKHTLHFDDVGGGEDVALDSYLSRIEGFGIPRDDPKALAEQDAILPMLELAVKALQQNLGGLFRPIASGLATSTFIRNFNTPFLSIPAFIWADVQLHIKYTHALPSKIKPKDLMAVAIDDHARSTRPAVLYVTMKKFAWYEPEPADIEYAIQCLTQDAQALQVFLGAVTTPEHALAMCPLNPEFYQWKPQLLSEARQILGGVDYGALCAKDRRFSEGHTRDSHGGLLPDDRLGDAEDEF